jgi:Ca2+-binding EF-hand superfamily protein
MMLRMIALGFKRDQHAYLRSGWNKFDGLLVCMSWIFFAIEKLFGKTSVNPKMVRMLRCLRPLRVASFASGIKAAIAQWEFLRNVGVVLLFTLSIFGVLGIQIFGGARTYGCFASDIDSGSFAGEQNLMQHPVTCPAVVSCPDDICYRKIDIDTDSGTLMEVPDISEISASDANATYASIHAGYDTVVNTLQVSLGYDNIIDAMMTGWIVTTGDIWGVNILTEMETTNSRYAGQAWIYFTMLHLIMNVVIANLFAAVIVHSYFAKSNEDDSAALDDKMRITKALFSRLDIKHEGEIPSERLMFIADLLGLEDTFFDSQEVLHEVESMDLDGNNTVDFEEFVIWWDHNSPFVVKLKKALKKQEESVRNAWATMDNDGDGLLHRDELSKMSLVLGISLQASEISAAAAEMGMGEEGCSYSVFMAWWLSPSKVAAKVRRSTQTLANNGVAKHLFELIDVSENGRIDEGDLMDSSKSAFGMSISRADVSVIMHECAPEGSPHITFDVFIQWWSSDQEWATKLRLKRQKDIADIEGLFESFSDKGSGVLEETRILLRTPGAVFERRTQEDPDVAYRDPSLGPPALTAMLAKLNISTSVDEVIHAIETWSGVTGLTEVGTTTFYEFTFSKDEVAKMCRERFGAYQQKLERSRQRPFLYIPVVSHACFDLVTMSYFDTCVSVSIILNAIVSACEYHEMDPTYFQLIQDANAFFSYFFIMEAFVKIIGLGLFPYFRDAGNRFDFTIISVIVIEKVVVGENGGSALRGLRVLMRSLRAVRSARVVMANNSAKMVIDTLVQSGSECIALCGFAMFIICVFSLVGGQLLGSCFTEEDQTMPDLNLHSFGDAFHVNFLLTMGESWSPIMMDYTECHPMAWIYFVISFAVMTYFVANLLVAMLVDGFAISEEEKLIKQQKNYIQSMRTESRLLLAAGRGEDTADAQSASASGTSRKASKVFSSMAKGARVQKLTGKTVRVNTDAESDGLQQNERSWGLFNVDNKVRMVCIVIAESSHFRHFIYFIITFSTIAMAVEGPPGAHAGNERVHMFFATVNVVTLIVFWLEFVIKTISDGFIGTPSPYLQSASNRFDFFVLMCCTIELIVDNMSVDRNVSRTLRVLRVLKPLRIVEHNETMQILVEALRLVMPSMIGVFILTFLVYCIFAILGVGLFMGRFHFCNCEGKWSLPAIVNCKDPFYSTLGRDECVAQGGSWESPPAHFDHFFAALRSLFLCSIGKGGFIIQSGMDVTEIYASPQHNHSWLFVTYFWAFMLLSNFFVFNIFIGILTNYFMESNGSALLTESQRQWAQTILSIRLFESYVPTPPKEGSLHRQAFDIVHHRLFEPLVTTVIIINVAALYIERVPQGDNVAYALEWVETVCLCFFTFDGVIRVSGMGIANYLRDNWSKLDVSILVTSWLSKMAGSSSAFSALRALRVLRVALLLKSSVTMRPIIRALMLSILPCINVLGLVTLVLFIFSIMSMSLFGLQPHGEFVTERDNYDSFKNSFTHLINIITGARVRPYLTCQSNGCI